MSLYDRRQNLKHYKYLMIDGLHKTNDLIYLNLCVSPVTLTFNILFKFLYITHIVTTRTHNYMFNKTGGHGISTYLINLNRMF